MIPKFGEVIITGAPNPYTHRQASELRENHGGLVKRLAEEGRDIILNGSRYGYEGDISTTCYVTTKTEVAKDLKTSELATTLDSFLSA